MIKRLLTNSKGDTLVEVLISMLIISMILAGSFVLANNSFKSDRKSQERSSAVQIAQTQVETLREQVDNNKLTITSAMQPFCYNGTTVVTITSANECNFDQSGNYVAAGSTEPLYKISIVPVGAAGGFLSTSQVAVSVSWDSFGGGTSNLGYSYRVLPPGFTYSSSSGSTSIGAGNSGGGGTCPSGQTGTPPNCVPICAPTTAPPFTYQANAPQTFTVPSGCSQMTIKVFGAQGGNVSYTFNNYGCTTCGPPVNETINGGRGGEVDITIPIGNGAGQIPAGSSLSIYAAQAGTTARCSGSTGAWGYSYGGDSCSTGTGGGGASAVTFNGTVLAIGAGGGGVGLGAETENGGNGTAYSAGGDGGGLTGNSGHADIYNDYGGGGGTQTSGGAAGFNNQGGGTQTSGGSGELGYCYYYYYYGYYCYDAGPSGAGGGGGGWWGGAAGYAVDGYPYAGGGGGGSSYANPAFANNVSYQTGSEVGDGQVIISYR